MYTHQKKVCHWSQKISIMIFSQNVLEFFSGTRDFFVHTRHTHQRFFLFYLLSNTITLRVLHIKRRNHHQKKALIKTNKMMSWCFFFCFVTTFLCANIHFCTVLCMFYTNAKCVCSAE